jgi:two-component system chemotaxis sensor kinase CheA
MGDYGNLIEDVEIVKEFLTESNDHLEDVESKIMQLEENPEDMDLINGIFRPIHSMKGSAGFLGLKGLGKVSHELETLLDEARKSKITITPEIVEILYEGVDILKKQREAVAKMVDTKATSPEEVEYQPLLAKLSAILGQKPKEAQKTEAAAEQPKPPHIGEILVTKGNISEGQLETALQEQDKRLGDILVEKGITTPEKVNTALKIQNSLGKQAAETVKVDTRKLDNLVNLVGELVIANALISEVMGNDGSGMNKNLSHLHKIVKEIQDQVMSMRMVALKSTFQKMARLVRDVSAKVGKKVHLEISGEDTELDKTVIEEIGDPLVHILRNSIDHGIEPREDRIAKGKSEEGLVKLNAFHRGGNIVIEIEDDGKGLSKDKIYKKAVEKGLIDGTASYTDQQIYNLVFAPGFSTADKVSDVSGRGVGMDVVKKNVERLRGKVDLTTIEGKGTKISIKLPLTLAIIDGMIVQVGEEKYIVPMLSIEESIRPKKEDISTVQQRGEMINVRGNLLPMVRLHNLYNIIPRKSNPWEALVLIVEGEGQRCGILVDDLLGQQQIVIKSLGDRFRNVRGVSGSAILGDGRVGLILDVTGVMNLALN